MIANPPKPPLTVIHLPTAAVTGNNRAGTHDVPPRKLIRRTLDGGAIGYSLPTNFLRSIVAKLIGTNRIAFVIHQAGTRSASIQIVGSSDRQIGAAVHLAAKHRSSDHVVIHVAGRVIEQAVAYNLNITTCIWSAPRARPLYVGASP